MSHRIPGITRELHEAAIKPAELTSTIRASETDRDIKGDLKDALVQFEEYKAALYGARITLTALMSMGAIGPNLDIEGFLKEVDRIRLHLGLPLEPSILNNDQTTYIIRPEGEE
jgi:hypothetical protein